MALGLERITDFLNEMFTQKEDSEKNVYNQIMRKPHSIEGYIKALNMMVREGQLEKA
jgi:hypothetical protein